MSWENPKAYALSKMASETRGRAHRRVVPESVYPGVTLTREVGEFGTLLAIDRARSALGVTPQHSWRDHMDPRSS
jgi:hypothetical protein